MEISLTAQFEIPLIFHAANFRNLVLTRECFSPRRFSYRFGMADKSNGSCMDILSRRLYQGFCLPCECHKCYCFYISSENLAYHPSYQAEGWECKTKYFVLVLVHFICCKTVWIWLSCHVLGKLVIQPGGK